MWLGLSFKHDKTQEFVKLEKENEALLRQMNVVMGE
jgi:hypothetical protein